MLIIIMERKMSDPQKTPKRPQQIPPQKPIPDRNGEIREKALPSVGQTPSMPPVKPPKKD